MAIIARLAMDQNNKSVMQGLFLLASVAAAMPKLTICDGPDCAEVIKIVEQSIKNNNRQIAPYISTPVTLGYYKYG